jgi:hypothetical protein
VRVLAQEPAGNTARLSLGACVNSGRDSNAICQDGSRERLRPAQNPARRASPRLSARRPGVLLGFDRSRLFGATSMSKSGETRGLVLALITYLMVFALKLGAYFARGVMVLLAEALHTLSDVFISGFSCSP